MNIFKRIGSFASNSWRDFCEFQETLAENTSILEPTKENDDSTTNLMHVKSDSDVIRRRSLPGFIRKRVSKKKVVDDPRSPSVAIVRTPMPEVENDSFDHQGILSPFNLKDMLETVESAVEITPPAEPVPKIDNQTTPDLTRNESLNMHKLVDMNDICNWNEFDYEDKAITDSLIVEVSSFDIKNTSIVDEIPEKDEEFIISCDNVDNIEKSIDGDDCQVIGCVIKKIPETLSSSNEVPIPKGTDKSLMITSTPKKQWASIKAEPAKDTPRTPLMAISNSPLVKDKKKKPAANKMNDNKKKKVNQNKRKLPRAPSTPMTPLHKFAGVATTGFDKENF